MPTRLAAAVCALALFLAACSSSGGSSASNSPAAPSFSAPADPLTDTVTDPVVTDGATVPSDDPSVDAPTDEDTPAADGPSLSADPTGATQKCIQAMSALQAAGADTLEPDAAPVRKTFTACRNVADWLAGLYTVPGALGYTPGKDLNDGAITNDIQVLCGANADTRTCKDAQKLGLLH